MTPVRLILLGFIGAGLVLTVVTLQPGLAESGIPGLALLATIAAAVIGTVWAVAQALLARWRRDPGSSRTTRHAEQHFSRPDFVNDTEHSAWLVTEVTEEDGATYVRTDEFDGPRVRILKVYDWTADGGEPLETWIPSEDADVLAYGPDEEDLVELQHPEMYSSPRHHGELRLCTLVAEHATGSVAGPSVTGTDSAPFDTARAGAEPVGSASDSPAVTTDAGDLDSPTTAAPPRDVEVIRRELADLERHLVDVPPHHGGGRADLERRADELRRELARARDTG